MPIISQIINAVKWLSKRPALSLFLIALTVRLGYFLAVGPWEHQVARDVILQKDAAGYQQLATNLLERGRFSTAKKPPYKPHTLRVPAYPLFIAGVYKIVGIHPWVVLLLQVFLGACTALLVYRIGRQFFTANIAFLGGLLFTVDYSAMFYASNLLTETLFTFLFALHIYFLTRYFTTSTRPPKSNIHNPTSKIPFLLLAGLFLGIATLTRPVSVYFFLFLLPVFFLYFRHHKTKAIVTFLLLTFSFLLVLSPWLIRNYEVKGKIMVSSQQADALYWAFPRLHRSFQHPFRQGSWKWEDIQHDVQHFTKNAYGLFFTIGSSGIPRLLGFDYEFTDVSQFKKKGLAFIWEELQTKPPLQFTVIALVLPFLLFIYAVTLYGIFVSWRRYGFTHISLLLIPIAYFILTAAGFAMTERFRVPMLPYLLLFVSFGVMTMYQKYLKGHARAKAAFAPEKHIRKDPPTSPAGHNIPELLPPHSTGTPTK